MAYEIPTAADLKTKYPAFAAVADATIDVYLADAAAVGADSTWAEADYAPAVLAFAAHQMALLGMGDQGEAAGYAAAGVSRVRSGQFEAWLDPAVVGRVSKGGLDATPYGRAYKLLLRKNKSGPRIAGGPVDTNGWCAAGQLNAGIILP
jgi:hypothetical protein